MIKDDSKQAPAADDLPWKGKEWQFFVMRQQEPKPEAPDQNNPMGFVLSDEQKEFMAKNYPMFVDNPYLWMSYLESRAKEHEKLMVEKEVEEKLKKQKEAEEKEKNGGKDSKDEDDGMPIKTLEERIAELIDGYEDQEVKTLEEEEPKKKPMGAMYGGGSLFGNNNIGDASISNKIADQWDKEN